MLVTLLKSALRDPKRLCFNIFLLIFFQRFETRKFAAWQRRPHQNHRFWICQKSSRQNLDSLWDSRVSCAGNYSGTHVINTWLCLLLFPRVAVCLPFRVKATTRPWTGGPWGSWFSKCSRVILRFLTTIRSVSMRKFWPEKSTGLVKSRLWPKISSRNYSCKTGPKGKQTT